MICIQVVPIRPLHAAAYGGRGVYGGGETSFGSSCLYAQPAQLAIRNTFRVFRGDPSRISRRSSSSSPEVEKQPCTPKTGGDRAVVLLDPFAINQEALTMLERSRAPFCCLLLFFQCADQPKQAQRFKYLNGQDAAFLLDIAAFLW